MPKNKRSIDAKMQGLEGVLKAMGTLKGSAQRRVVRKAITEATKPILKDAKARAPKESGLLKKSMGRKTVTLKKKGIVLGFIGPRTGFKRQVTIKQRGKPPRTVTRDPVRYAHLREFGTSTSAAHAFLRPAWDSNLSRTNRTMAKRMGKEIEIEAEKAARKARKK